jgi:low temperature requirement protein LtrA
VILLGMLAIAALAIQIPDVTQGASTGFAVAYIVLRSLMIVLYLRSYRHVPEARPLIVRYTGAYSLGVGLWIVSLAFGSPTRFVLWGVALGWEYSQPTLVRRLHQTIPVHTSHVPERFALFTLIVLGESVVAVALGTADSNWQASSAAAAALSFLVAVALWWVYYGDGTTLALSRTAWSILVFTHVHIPLLAALTAVSAGITVAIRDAGMGHLDVGSRWALCGGAALYLVCLTEAQLATVQGLTLRTKVARFATAAMLIVLAAASSAAAPLVVMVVVTSLLVGLVTLELWSASHARTAVEPGPSSRAARAGS